VECTIGGTIYENTILDNSCSAYNMVSDYQIPKGIKLTIDPDVVINGNSKTIKVEGELKINGSEGRLVEMTNVNIKPAGYPEKIKINIKYVNINPSSSFNEHNYITVSSTDEKYRSDGFILENSTINSAQILGTQIDGSVKISNNNFKWNAGFWCNDCNYNSENKGVFTATGNKFGEYSSLNVNGGTRFKKIIITDNEFNKGSGGLSLQGYTDSWNDDTEDGRAQVYEVIGNKFTESSSGITSTQGKFIINDNVFIKSPGIKYNGNDSIHSFEIKKNTFCKQKGYAISNTGIWNGKRNCDKQGTCIDYC